MSAQWLRGVMAILDQSRSLRLPSAKVLSGQKLPKRSKAILVLDFGSMRNLFCGFQCLGPQNPDTQIVGDKH